MPAYTTDTAAPRLPPPPPPRGTRPEERGSGAPAAPPGVASGPQRSASAGTGGYGGIVAGAIFSVVVAVGVTAWLHRTGHLGACWAQVHALIMAWNGQRAVEQGFELMGEGAAAVL